MVKRKVVFRKKRQNRLGMFLVLMVVLMLLVGVSLKSAELRQKQETYAARERVLQEQIDAEKARTEEIEEYRKYTQTKKYVEEVAKDYPDVELSHMLVDNCAMQLVKDPAQFDVILTENMFGDILSDEASMVTGSIGMLSSASLNDTKFGLYEPSHGSAPDIAGKDLANPIATVLSAAMMLRYTFDLDKEAEAVEEAVRKVLAEGYRTGDIMAVGCTLVGCSKMGDLLAERI